MCAHLLPFGVAVEVVRPHFFTKHHVIVEVNKLLGEAWDAVDVGLYRGGAERGQVAVVLEDVLSGGTGMYSKSIMWVGSPRF